MFKRSFLSILTFVMFFYYKLNLSNQDNLFLRTVDRVSFSAFADGELFESSNVKIASDAVLSAQADGYESINVTINFNLNVVSP